MVLSFCIPTAKASIIPSRPAASRKAKGPNHPIWASPLRSAFIASPQSPIVARVAFEFGLNSIIGFGNTTVDKARKQIGIQWCEEYNSELVVLSESQGFNNVLYSNLNKLNEERKFFPILFGYAAQTYRSSNITRIAEQVENIEF